MHRLVALSLFSVLAHQAKAIENNLPVVVAIPEQVTEGGVFSLLFAGTSPDGCGLARDAIRIENDVITVVYRRNNTNLFCTQALTPFRVPITVFENGQTAKAGTYKVRIELLDGVSQQTKLLSFALVPVSKAGSPAIQPESGHWNVEEEGPYATSGSGVSFSFERQGTTAVNISNFYGGDGSPEWYINSGPMTASVLNAPFYTVSGGQGLFEAYKPPAEVEYSGTLLFEFSSPTRGTAWITQPIGSGLLDGLKVMPVSIKRFNYGFGAMNKALSGRWVLSSEGASTLSAQNLDFVALGDTGNTLNAYASGDFRLSCAANAARPNLLNESCVLTRSGSTVASFDRVGYQRLRGLDTAGKAVSLFRVD